MAGGAVQLNTGDALFLSTDGVAEANNAALDDFTDERLVAVLSELHSKGRARSVDCAESGWAGEFGCRTGKPRAGAGVVCDRAGR